VRLLPVQEVLEKIIKRSKREKGIDLKLRTSNLCLNVFCWELYKEKTFLSVPYKKEKVLLIEKDLRYMVNCIVFDAKILPIIKEEVNHFAEEVEKPAIISFR